MSRLTLFTFQLLVAVVAVLLWQVLTTVPIGGVKLLPPFFFSTPSDVAARIVKWFVDGTIWKHLWITLVESVLAFYRLGCRSPDRLLVHAAAARGGVRSLRQDDQSRCRAWCWRLLRALARAGHLVEGRARRHAVFFIVFFNVSRRKEVSSTVLAMPVLGMNERALMRHVYWPSALSWMFSSLHTAVGFAVVGAVVGEYLGSAAGLGYLIQQAEGVFDVAGVFAGMFVLATFVLVIDYLVTLVERRLLVWRPVAAETRT